MNNRPQQTLACEFAFQGRGLHTGKETRLTVRPAPANSGYRLRAGGYETRITPFIADGSRHRTVIRCDETEVHTVEHLLAALFGAGVDNALIEVEGGEIPAGDGSALAFAEHIQACGLQAQEAESRPASPAETVAAADGSAAVMAFPSKDGELKISYFLDYPESPLARGVVEWRMAAADEFLASLAPARTFVMKQHADAMRKAGFGQGADTQNTLAIDGEKVLENRLRFADECIRHKILDLLGDLATIGRRLAAHVVAYKSGHALNLELARRLSEAILRAEHPRGVLDIKQIERTLPHRYPFLLVDRVLAMEPRRRIVAVKNVTRNEEFFQGHFPGQPIMPGVLQIEALAQTGGILMMGDPAGVGKLAVLMGIEDVKFRRPVVPGDTLRMEVIFQKFKGRIGVVYARASVNGDVATEATIKFALVDPQQYT